MKKTGAQLVEEMIELASDNTEPVNVLLRKCLVLAAVTRNDNLKLWAEKELNGYALDDPVPKYRSIGVHSRGYFRGPMGMAINDQPLPSGILDEKHRPLVILHELRAAIASYDHLAAGNTKKGKLKAQWPADMIVHYQSKFIEGYHLADAWQEIPVGAIVALNDTVRTRVLSFVLEIEGALVGSSGEVENLPPDKINQSVVNNIFGGVALFGGSAQTITQIGSIEVGIGDLQSLTRVLKSVGLTDADVVELRSAIDLDKEQGKGGIGQRTTSWIANYLPKVGKAGLKVSAEVALTSITRAVLGYCGLPT